MRLLDDHCIEDIKLWRCPSPDGPWMETLKFKYYDKVSHRFIFQNVKTKEIVLKYGNELLQAGVFEHFMILVDGGNK